MLMPRLLRRTARLNVPRRCEIGDSQTRWLRGQMGPEEAIFDAKYVKTVKIVKNQAQTLEASSWEAKIVDF